MKLLSVAIPCYNSAGYMCKCIDSLLVGGEDVEIIIVDDGSTKDNTAQIADDYAKRYPSIVKAVHKENGGHGSAVNTGLANATGLYFKVVDSDDWVKEDSYLRVLDKLREFVAGSDTVDMLICNYVYEKEGEKHKKVISYKHTLPRDVVFTWSDCKRFQKGHYILMHSVIFRTQLLKECGLVLPEHTFYVDNIYVFEPLVKVNNMYYLDENFYRYYIGREDQSVNEKIMISRIDQQIRVNKIMFDFYSNNKKSINAEKKRAKYMFNYLEIITVVSSVLLLKSGTEENLEKKAKLWKYFEDTDKGLYKKLRHGIFGSAINLPGKGGRKITVDGYRIAQKVFKFN